jgi:AraC-like DNA-binding protein
VFGYFSAELAAKPFTRRIVPDGSVDILFNLGDGRGARAGFVEPQVAVVGVTIAPVWIERPAMAPLFGLSFMPGAASAFLRVPVSSLNDQVVDLRDLWGQEADDLLGRLRELRTTTDRSQYLDGFLARKLANVPGPDPALAAAVMLIRANGGRLSMRALVEKVGISERRLQRLFREGTGLSPKGLSRIARLHAVLARLKRSSETGMSWAALSSDLGFADQAHLIREFRALAGVTPATYARQGALSDLFNTALAEEASVPP